MGRRQAVTGRDNMRCILKRDEERDLKERQKRGRGEAGAEAREKQWSVVGRCRREERGNDKHYNKAIWIPGQ